MWIEELFQNILHMSLIGSFVILLVLVARGLLRKVPKIYSYALWAVVLFRLLCPVSFTSEFSVIPKALVESENIVSSVQVTEREYGNKGDVVDTWVYEKKAETEDVVFTYTKPISEGEISVTYPTWEWEPLGEEIHVTIRPIQVVAFLWLVGSIGFAVYSLITMGKLYRKLEAAVHIRDNIYICDYIETPFTLGIVSPKIYLPSDLEQAETDYIIAHEKHHIRRFDHIIKTVAYITLCIHWFNPLVWISFILAGKDMEMSCDEAVMRKAGEDIKAAYSTSLLRLSTGRKNIAIAPLAFGEGNVKVRIKNVMNYKKPSFWVVIISVVACILLGIVLCANPKVEEEQPPTDSIIEETMVPEDTSSEEPTYEAQIRDVTVWEKAVDYDGDATVDTISFVIQADGSYEKYGGVTDGQELLRAPFIGIVKCINGATKELSFASGNISHDRMGNYQISYTEIDGKHYMISTEIGEQMGSAYYCYEVYSLTEETLVDSYEIYFVTAGDDFRARPTDKYRQEVVPEFKEKLDKWIANAELIVATDVNERVEDGIFVSSLETTYEASYYYDLVWARMLDEKVRVDNYGPMVNLPDNADWIRNPQYLLSSYPVAHIKYFDNAVKAPLLLRYGQMEHMDLAYLHGMTFDRDLQTVWNVGEGENSVEILCQVSNEASQPEKKTVLVTWTYEDMNYVIFGELDKDADETTLAKTAIYVVENFENFHVPEDNKLIGED